MWISILSEIPTPLGIVKTLGFTLGVLKTFNLVSFQELKKQFLSKMHCVNWFAPVTGLFASEN